VRILALLAGALPALAFPEPARWWFAYVALIPLLVVIRAAPTAREAAVRGWLGGAGFIFAVHHWLLPNLLVFLPVVSAVFGLLWLPWSRVAWHLLRPPLTGRRAAAALALLPAGWIVIELVRSWERLGGPWALMGTSQWQVTAGLALATLGGVWLVSLVVVLVNVAVAIAAMPGASARPRLGALAVVVATVAAAAGWTAVRPQAVPTGQLTVAVVQPGVIHGAAARFDAGEELTRRLAGRDLDLVVWGESSVGFDLPSRPDLQQRLADASRSVGAPILTNVDARRAGSPGILKSSVLVGPDGLLARYDKRRLVPFGEYVPLRPLFDWSSQILEAADEDRLRGDEIVVMDAGGFDVGPLVCFESAFPDMSRELAQRGAELIVYQSNTSTFQQSWAPEQHASIAALRAAEIGRPVVHATLTGTSAVYDASGRRLAEPLSTQVSGSLVVEVPLVTGGTPYRSAGDVVPALAVLTVALALAGSLAGHRFSRLRTPCQSGLERAHPRAHGGIE
jgi:apolipoprotein N-acyltransferase